MKSKRDIEKREDRITYLANKKIDKTDLMNNITKWNVRRKYYRKCF